MMTDPVNQVITDLFSGRDGRFIKVGEQWLGAFPDGLVIIKKVAQDQFGYQVEARVIPLAAVDVITTYRYGLDEDPGDNHGGEVLIKVLDGGEFRLGLKGMARHGYQEKDFAWVSELLRFKLRIE
jgi:hypothetical protein